MKLKNAGLRDTEMITVVIRVGIHFITLRSFHQVSTRMLSRNKWKFNGYKL